MDFDRASKWKCTARCIQSKESPRCLNTSPGSVVFVSDKKAELDAAHLAHMKTLLCAPLEIGHNRLQRRRSFALYFPNGLSVCRIDSSCRMELTGQLCPGFGVKHRVKHTLNSARAILAAIRKNAPVA